MNTAKDTIAKWVIVCTSFLWITVGFWGVYHCLQITKYARSTPTLTASINTITSNRELNQVLGLNVLQASMVFVACIIASIFVIYSVFTMKTLNTTTTQTKTKPVHA